MFATRCRRKWQVTGGRQEAVAQVTGAGRSRRCRHPPAQPPATAYIRPRPAVSEAERWVTQRSDGADEQRG